MESVSYGEEIIKLIKMRTDIVEKIGDCSNREKTVDVNSKLWKTIAEVEDFTLQKNIISNRARIVDDEGVQRANGSCFAMCEKLKRLTAEEFLVPGDVIGVSRGAYEHYAIYAGNNKVIHYAGESSDFGDKITIHEASFEEFLKDGKMYFVVVFDDTCTYRLQSVTKFIISGYFDDSGIQWKEKYSNEDTLERAYSRIGEAKYSIVNNNCEHFALWCKTGKSVSTQVRLIAKYVIVSSIGIRGISESRRELNMLL